jgi:GntR family transcriptional regulator
VNSLKFEIDFRSGIPGYLQIVEQVQRWLSEGEIKPGDQLPTVRQLASELRVNFNTIARAYRMLDDAGLISTQRGRGTYLLDRPTEETKRLLRTETLELQIKRMLASLSRQGFTKEEINQKINTISKTWNKESIEKELENEN